MTETSMVPIGHTLSVVHQRQFCVTGSSGINNLLMYMAQIPLVGPQVPLFWPVARHSLVRQHPWLLRIPMPHFEDDAYLWARNWAWLDKIEESVGTEHLVTPCTDEDWQRAAGHPRAPRAVDASGQQIRIAFVNPMIAWIN